MDDHDSGSRRNPPTEVVDAVASDQTSPSPPRLRARVRLGEAGRLVIPAPMRTAMAVRPGDTLLLALGEDGELRVVGRRQALRQLQQELRHYRKPGESIVDEFLAEKRAEAARE